MAKALLQESRSKVSCRQCQCWFNGNSNAIALFKPGRILTRIALSATLVKDDLTHGIPQ
jgi:hypothetical protein